MEKEREAFEDWANQDLDMSTMKLRLDRKYYDAIKEKVMWPTWQARARQTITLPVKDATGEH